jgi:hypothetical protein
MNAYIESGNKKFPYLVPVRIIMNNSTLSVFKAE